MRARDIACVALTLITTAAAADSPGVIGLPGQGVTLLDGLRTLREDWGSVTLRVECEGQVETATAPTSPLPERVYACRSAGRAGPCEVEALLFRAPTDPRPCDAIRATIRNRSQAATKARLIIAHEASTQGLALSLGGLNAGARMLIALPEYGKPTLPMNAWGLASGAGPLPGWASPNEPCDPAFRNIRVGWRGEPITYRFRVEPKGVRTVALGVCESHWDIPKQRPLILQVEGAADVRVDPIADWGRHVPRCIGFQAGDVDGDGMLTVTSITPADAPDRNSILNAIWVFAANASEDLEAVKRGERTAAAEYYVDCGGDKDPSLYAVGDITYDLDLPPGASRTLTFLVACAGATAPEGLPDEGSADRLWGQTKALWDEWFAQGSSIGLPDQDVQATLDASLAAIAMLRGQASKYLIPLPTPAGDSFSYPAACDITQALDLTGHHREAEGCLLMLWDSNLPQPIARWGQQEDGAWPCPEGYWGAQGRVLSALASHYLLTRDRAWLQQAYPSVRKGTDRLIAALAEHGGRLPEPAAARPGCGPNVWAARALAGASSMTSALGKADDVQRFAQAARSLPAEATAPTGGIEALRECMEGRSWQGFLGTEALPDAGAGARFVLALRDMLVDETDGEVRLLAGVPSEWLSGEGGVAVDHLPTTFGPLSFRARLTEPKVLKVAVTPSPRLRAVTIALPFPAQVRAVGVTPPSRVQLTKDGRDLRLTLAERPASVIVDAR
ncbi:MAG: hypothetical protein FJX75_07305 [Armatimonadetes bacterium]|nr:hypothetical protein [Armatimonadota bacterium]